jgi:dolichol-phosphate mannosyltransferase
MSQQIRARAADRRGRSGRRESALPASWLRRFPLFLIGGGSAAVLNLVLAYVGVDLLGLRSDLQQNVVNLVAMEISLVYAFFVYRTFVWKIETFDTAVVLLRQLPLYHLSAGAGVLSRLLLFPLLQSFGVHYLINIAFGILIGAAVNYALADRYVFKGSGDGGHP